MQIFVDLVHRTLLKLFFLPIKQEKKRKQAEIERKRAEVRARMEEASKAKKAKKGFMTPERKKKLRVSKFYLFIVYFILKNCFTNLFAIIVLVKLCLKLKLLKFCFDKPIIFQNYKNVGSLYLKLIVLYLLLSKTKNYRYFENIYVLFSTEN